MSDPGSSDYLLKRNNFGEAIQRSYEWMLTDKDFTDVTLACGDTLLPAHRAVLASSSPVLRRVLLATPRHTVIYLQATEPAVLRAVMEFIYLGETEVTSITLDSFLVTATELRLEGIAAQEAGGELREVEDGGVLCSDKEALGSTKGTIAETLRNQERQGRMAWEKEEKKTTNLPAMTAKELLESHTNSLWGLGRGLDLDHRVKPTYAETGHSKALDILAMRKKGVAKVETIAEKLKNQERQGKMAREKERGEKKTTNVPSMSAKELLKSHTNTLNPTLGKGLDLDYRVKPRAVEADHTKALAKKGITNVDDPNKENRTKDSSAIAPGAPMACDECGYIGTNPRYQRHETHKILCCQFCDHTTR